MRSPASPDSPTAAVTIGAEPSGSPAARWIFGQAEAELEARYGFIADPETGRSTGDFEPPAGTFLVARAAGVVGGVGIRPHAPGIGEDTRLWVDPAWRGLGIARSLMEALEVAARSLGYEGLRLETGTGQPEAVALYAGAGWERQTEGWEGGPIREGSVHFAKGLS